MERHLGMVNDVKIFHTGFGSRERDSRSDTCPKCNQYDAFKIDKHYRICTKCGYVESRLSPRKGKKLKDVKGLIKAMYGGMFEKENSNENDND